MLSFRNRVLDYPDFDFHCDNASKKMVQLEKHHTHTFMPYYSVNIFFESPLSRQGDIRLSDIIIKTFGYIPFGTVKSASGLAGLSFSIEDFSNEDFVFRFSKILQDRGYVTQKEADQLCQRASSQRHLLLEYLQAEKLAHTVPPAEKRLIELIKQENPSLAAIQALLSDDTIHVNAQDGYGETALALAVGRNRVDIVELLLEHGADPHTVDWFGSRALGSAAYTNKIDVAKILLEHGADPNIYWSDSPLHHAFAMASDEMVELLTSYGADISCVNYRGETPVNQSINWRHHDNGLTVKRRVKAAERGRQKFILRNGSAEELQAFMRTKLLNEIKSSQDTLIEKIDAACVSVQSGILTKNDLFNFFKVFKILAKPMHQSQYNVWFRACMQLQEANMLKVPDKLTVPRASLSNLAVFKSAYLHWVKTLDRDSAIKACQITCNSKTLVGQLMYQQRGWYAPSINRGTLKQIHVHMQRLLQERPAVQVVKQSVRKPKPEQVQHKEKQVLPRKTKSVTDYDAICNKLRDLTKSNLYPKLSSQQVMEESLQELSVKHEKIQLLQEKKRAIETDVDKWLFGYSMFAKPAILPDPIQPQLSNLDKQDNIAGSLQDEAVDRLIASMPDVPDIKLNTHATPRIAVKV